MSIGTAGVHRDSPEAGAFKPCYKLSRKIAGEQNLGVFHPSLVGVAIEYFH